MMMKMMTSRIRSNLLSYPLRYAVAPSRHYLDTTANVQAAPTPHKSCVPHTTPFVSALHRRHRHYQFNTNILNATPPRGSFLVPMAKKIKRAGQALAAIVVFSVVQGLMLLHKYRFDARGQLKYPDGLTLGNEDYDDNGNTEQEERVIETSIDDDKRRGTNSFSILDSLLPYFITANEGSCSESAASRNPNSSNTQYTIPSLLRKLNSAKNNAATKDPIRVLVIGDSLAIGVGCIEQFVATKRSHSLHPTLIENTEAKSYLRQGPVFPQVLARTLSRHFQLPVQWRSAGVDGGDVDDIRSYCLDVVKQECTQGVDIVVVLFGMNDLKRLLPDNPFQLVPGKQKLQDVGALSQFRNGIEMLLSDIRSTAPGAVIVLPELPFQTKILPFGLMINVLLGVWERLKRMVVKGRSNAMYLELDAKEISDLYSNSKSYGTLEKALIDEHGLCMIEECDDDDVDDNPLLSPDGVHPNKKLYQKWAEIVGRKMYVRIQQQNGLVEKRNYNAKD